jgi:hypothetical protein
MPAPNRVAVYLAAAAALLGALAPVIADMDWESTAGLIAGLGGIVTVVYKWLDGWQKFEAREDQDLALAFDEDFDPEAAEIPEQVRAAARADIPEEASGGQAPQ